MSRNGNYPIARSQFFSTLDDCREQSSEDEDDKLPSISNNKMHRKPPKVSQSSK